MKIRFKYFGKIQEVAGMEEEIMEIQKHSNTEVAIQMLLAKYPSLKFANYSIAVNQTIVNKKVELQEAGEIAVLPPFAGG